MATEKNANAGEVWTIGKILKWTEQYFAKGSIEAPRLDAEVLLSHVLKKERIYLYVHFDQPMEANELSEYKECIKRRVKHEPVAYITGHKEFMGLDFQVTRDTLIPRPDTEILVEAVLKRLRPAGEGCTIADIGTGTGAICLSLLNYLPQLQGIAVDISQGALDVARNNAESLGLSERAEFLLGDLLEPLKAQMADTAEQDETLDALEKPENTEKTLEGRKLSAIVSNPPYIPRQDIEGLEADVRSFEPMGALDGGVDGLDFYRRLMQESADLLEPEGFLALEVGIHQAQQLKALGQDMPQWRDCEIIRDLAGIERVVILWKA